MKKLLAVLVIVVLVAGGWAVRSWQQSWQPLDEDLVAIYRQQVSGVTGNVGILFTGLKMPETLDSQPDLFLQISRKPARTWPWPISALLAESYPTLLMDETQFHAREAAEPQRLVDSFGRDRDPNGVPYMDKYRAGQLTWVPPRDRFDLGYYVDESARTDWPEFAQRPTVKSRVWYYGTGLNPPLMPHERGVNEVVDMAMAKLQQRYGELPMRHVNSPISEDVRTAVFELLDAGVDTLILVSTQTSLSTFKGFGVGGSYYSAWYHARDWQRANPGREIRILMADSLGNFQPMRDAFVELLKARLDTLPPGSDVDVLLSQHGMPWDRFPEETFRELAAPYFAGLRQDIEALFRQYEFGRTRITEGQDLYADDDYDKENRYTSTNEAYRNAAADGFDVIITVPTTFYAENTDTLFGHAIYTFDGLEGFEPFATIDYPDWSQPLVREFRLGDTRVIYNGLPVGPYARHVADAMVEAVEALMGEG